MNIDKLSKLALISIAVAVATCMPAQIYAAQTYSFNPSLINLENLPHAYYYTWGISFDVPDGEVITEAVLTFHDIYDWQYDIPAMESTSNEILDAFRKANPDDNLLDDILKELLELADLVKFAREDPLPVDNQTNLNNAYIFVQKTYPLFYDPELNNEADHE